MAVAPLLHQAGSLGATAVALSPDGALLAAALADGERALLALYEVASGRQRMVPRRRLQPLSSPTLRCRARARAPLARPLLRASPHARVAPPCQVLHAHHRTVHELSWSTDAERLVTVSADGTAKVRPRLPAAPRPLVRCSTAASRC